MKLGLTHLVDADLLPLVAETRAFYARRVAGRGPSCWAELQAARAAAAPPHGFTGHATPMARAALDRIEAYLRAALA